MFKIINSILVLGLVSLFAGGGGHSFGGEKNSVKYGNKSAHVNIFNDWGGILNEVTGNKSIFSW